MASSDGDAGKIEIGGKKMNQAKYIFPVTLMVLDVIAAVVYLCNGDVKKCVYWIAAAVLSFTVTF